MTEVVLDTAAAPKDPPLPVLRDDLGLFPGPRNSRGEATWTLHDPVRNKYFRIGEREFELLSRWQSATGMQDLANSAAADGIAVDTVDVTQFVDFLRRSELTQGDPNTVTWMKAAHKARQQTLWKKILHNYLFLRVPLVQPDPWLDRFYPLLRPLLSRRFAQLTALVGMLAIFLVVRQWELFFSTFMGFLSWEGAAAFAVALGVVKVLHESGHAIACRHFGLRVPTIGVAFIVMWPVMYTDATEAWRLTSRRARVTIAAAGMLTELTIACYATLLWVLLPDGLLRSAMFLLATTTWIMSLAVNLNPLMKFDGYYLFSDIFDIPNLQDRGFELARNRLRHALFGVPLVNDPGLLPGEHRIAIGWAYATWLYRFFLFLGIALLVYAFFFKALGIFLFLVEIWWFIAAPIWREVRNWREMAAKVDLRRKRLAMIGGAGLLLLLLLPWESSFRAPGVLKAAEQQKLFPAEPSRVLAMHAQNGSKVYRGDLVMELDSPDLEAELAAARAQVASAEYDLARVMSSQDTSRDRLVAEETLAQARSLLAGLVLRDQKRRVTAPFDGVVTDIPPTLRPGLWVGEKQSLGVLVGTAGGVVADAWVTEDYLRFVKAGDVARFYPDDIAVAPRDGVVESVDNIDTRVLGEPYLVATYGGDIDVRPDADGQPVPEQAVYRVRVRIDAQVGDLPMRVLRGELRLGGDDRSLLERFWTFLAGTIRRESGF
ncbi:MAG: HlyD family efflux transporter periplasmic adaptor subunit [Gammaproteobacteria bacterium]